MLWWYVFQHWLTRDSRILLTLDSRILLTLDSIQWSGGVAELGQQNIVELYSVFWQCGLQHCLTRDSRLFLTSIQWSGGVPYLGQQNAAKLYPVV